MCPGNSISITCTHNNTAGELTRWRVTASDTGAVECEATASHSSRIEQLCGPFTITMVSDNTGPTVTSTAVSSDTSSVNGITVQCFAGGLSSSPEVGSLNISRFGKVDFMRLGLYFSSDIPTPVVLSVDQISQSKSTCQWQGRF